MEPAGHVHVGRVGQRPFGAGGSGYIDGDEIDGQDRRNDQERHDTAGLGAAGQLIGTDQAAEDKDPADPLIYGGVAIDLEQHRFSFHSGTCVSPAHSMYGSRCSVCAATCLTTVSSVSGCNLISEIRPTISV